VARGRECLEKYWLLDVTACIVATTLLPHGKWRLLVVLDIVPVFHVT